MDRQLINYLPSILREIREFRAISGSEQTDIERVWDDAEKVLDEQFLDSAAKIGVSRWEDILGIVPASSDTLDDRKFRIYTLINASTPYTETVLRERLSELCEDGDYDLEIDYNNYALYIRIALSRRSQYDSMMKLLNKMVPGQYGYKSHAEI